MRAAIERDMVEDKTIQRFLPDLRDALGSSGEGRCAC
jgi:hypothetical protein